MTRLSISLTLAKSSVLKPSGPAEALALDGHLGWVQDIWLGKQSKNQSSSYPKRMQYSVRWWDAEALMKVRVWSVSWESRRGVPLCLPAYGAPTLLGKKKFLGCLVRLGVYPLLYPFLQVLPNNTHQNVETFSSREFFIVFYLQCGNSLECGKWCCR